MIALDANLLVHAHRPDAQFHREANAVLNDLANSSQRRVFPWPCVHEFMAVVTHPRIYKTPTPLEIALVALGTLNALPNMDFIGEGEGYLERLDEIEKPARIIGGAIHDARIAAICKFHGVKELCSADRDFPRPGATLPRDSSMLCLYTGVPLSCSRLKRLDDRIIDISRYERCHRRLIAINHETSEHRLLDAMKWREFVRASPYVALPHRTSGPQ
jgi:predicted nucleic acid-binding protein